MSELVPMKKWSFKWIRSKVKYAFRFRFGRLMNWIGWPGHVADVEIREHGNRVTIRRGLLFTIINVNGIDLYFYRWNGKYDGWGRGVCEGEDPEDLVRELHGPDKGDCPR